MDNDLKLMDVINDPVALDQFLDFPVFESESSNLDEVVSNSIGEDFLNFENCHLEYPSSVDGAADVSDWNFGVNTVSSDMTGSFFDHPTASAVAGEVAVSVPDAALPQRCGPAVQNLPVGYIAAPGSNYNTSHGFTPVQTSRNNVNDINQLSGNAMITDNSLQRLHTADKVVTNFGAAAAPVDSSTFVLNNAGNANGNQLLMNVQPQNVVQNGAVRIQYVQFQNQLPNTMHAGTVVQNVGAAQLPANSLKQIQLQQHQGQQLLAQGVQGNINLQGTIVPTATGNRILIRTGNQSVPGTNSGHNLQSVQICNSNFVGGAQDASRLPSQVFQYVAGGVRQGVRMQQPQIVGQTDAATGQMVDANTSLSGGRQVILQRTTGVGSQNVMYQQLPQQSVTLPVDTIGSHENNGLVVQIGNQTYRFEPSQQSSAAPAAGGVGQAAVFPQSQNVGFNDGNMVSQDPVQMLQQNVQLQQMLIGNQINVLQLLQKQQQQQQRLQPKVQQFGGAQEVVGGSNVIVNPVEVGPRSSSPLLVRATLPSQPLRPASTGCDASLVGGNRIVSGLRPSVTNVPTSQTSGLQFIQPKPSASVGIPGTSSLNVLQPNAGAPALQLGTQPQSVASNVNRNVGLNVQPSAQIVTTLSGNLQHPQTLQPSTGGQTTAVSRSQAVTTVQLSAEQQNLLVKIQSQMKTLLDLPKRNPDQEKYLQMLVSGQQRIISQGASQYLQQQKTTGVKVAAGVPGSGQPQQSTVGVGQPQQSAAGVVQRAISAVSGSLSHTGSTGNAVSNPATVVSNASSATSTTPSESSGAQNSGQVKAEDLFHTLPHLKEKLDAHMAKLSPEQRQWFAKNQPAVFAKLLQHHRLLLERDKKESPSQPDSKQPVLSQPQKNTSEGNVSSDSAATRVVRSLHLTCAQKFHLYLQKDQKRATHPEYSKPFDNFKDVIRGLVPYHVFQAREQSTEEMSAVEETFEEKAREMLERKDSMLRKYRLLLLEESMRLQLTSEMVLLERAFHSHEKALLSSEKRQAEEDPDSFVPRPVLKRLKSDDDDEDDDDDDNEGIKKEEDEDDGKDEEMLHRGEDLKVEDTSLDESVVKCRSDPTSPKSRSANSSSIEQFKSLQIKLEKLDDSDAELTKFPCRIDKIDSTRVDFTCEDSVRSKNRGEHTDNSNSKSSKIPGAAIASCRSFTEDDAAVASLLNTECLTDASPHFDERYVNRVIDSDSVGTAGFTHEKSARTSEDSASDGFNNSSFTTAVGFDAGDPDNDDMMQGTIACLMADLTQFNYDLNNSWASGELKSDVIRNNARQNTVPNAMVKDDSSRPTAGGNEDGSTESLQYEMQCAIDSIIQLQQPFSDDAGRQFKGEK